MNVVYHIGYILALVGSVAYLLNHPGAFGGGDASLTTTSIGAGLVIGNLVHRLHRFLCAFEKVTRRTKE